MIGPAIVDLELLQRWLQTAPGMREPVSSVVTQALAAARCHSSGAETVYVDYLSELEQGRHVPALLENLALPNLQLAPAVLLAWRESLRRLGPPPEGLDRLVLECLAVVQPMQQLRQAERHSLRDPLTGLPDRGALPQLLQQVQQQTTAPRCVAFLYVEVLLGGAWGAMPCCMRWRGAWPRYCVSGMCCCRSSGRRLACCWPT